MINVEKSGSSSIIELLRKNYTKGLESLMDNSIPQKTENTKRYLPHDIKTKENAVKTYLNDRDIEYTYRKYHISRYSLWRWVKKYDGTKESLEDKGHKPKTRHSRAHTNQEIKWIRNYVRRNPRITLCELCAKLKREKGYKRKITSLYRVMKRLNIKFYKGMDIKNISKKKHNKKFETPKNIFYKSLLHIIDTYTILYKKMNKIT